MPGPRGVRAAARRAVLSPSLYLSGSGGFPPGSKRVSSGFGEEYLLGLRMKFLVHVRVDYSHDGVPKLLFVVVNSTSLRPGQNF